MSPVRAGPRLARLVPVSKGTVKGRLGVFRRRSFLCPQGEPDRVGKQVDRRGGTAPESVRLSCGSSRKVPKILSGERYFGFGAGHRFADRPTLSHPSSLPLHPSRPACGEVIPLPLDPLTDRKSTRLNSSH